MKLDFMRIKDVISSIEYAKENKYEYLITCIQSPLLKTPTLVVDYAINFDKKIKYYLNHYNEDGTLKTDSSVGIVYVDYHNDAGKLISIATYYFKKLKSVV